MNSQGRGSTLPPYNHTVDPMLPTSSANEALHMLMAAFDELADLMQKTSSEAYEALVKVTVDHLPGAQWASVTTMHSGRFSTEACSGSVAEKCDALQYHLGSGPGVDAEMKSAVFHTNHLRGDDRCPEFGANAASVVGIESMLSYPLLTDNEQTVTRLHLYSSEEDTFDERTVALGSLLATHAAVAINVAMQLEHVAHLQRALETNRVIATAVGIVMTERSVTRDQAFKMLTVTSKRSNRKVHAIAEELIEGGNPGFVVRPPRET